MTTERLQGSNSDKIMCTFINLDISRHVPPKQTMIIQSGRMSLAYRNIIKTATAITAATVRYNFTGHANQTVNRLFFPIFFDIQFGYKTNILVSPAMLY